MDPFYCRPEHVEISTKEHTHTPFNHVDLPQNIMFQFSDVFGIFLHPANLARQELREEVKLLGKGVPKGTEVMAPGRSLVGRNRFRPFGWIFSTPLAGYKGATPRRLAQQCWQCQGV